MTNEEKRWQNKLQYDLARLGGDRPVVEIEETRDYELTNPFRDLSVDRDIEQEATFWNRFGPENTLRPQASRRQQGRDIVKKLERAANKYGRDVRTTPAVDVVTKHFGAPDHDALTALRAYPIHTDINRPKLKPWWTALVNLVYAASKGAKVRDLDQDLLRIYIGKMRAPGKAA